MGIRLKVLDEKIKQSDDINTLTNACVYYHNLIKYLEGIKKVNNPKLFGELIGLCYIGDDSEESISIKKINDDIFIATSNYMEYLLILKDKIISEQKTKSL